ncbi:MAG: DUF1080 domain-containing protein [Kiritimatiellae bacterium]|nr:DUF1080 domain-containing protein [Kiritimatiellia bacterium]
MKKSASVCLILCMLTLAINAADKPKTEIPEAGADGWISLFNSCDLSGWEGFEDYWSVVDGAIQGTETKETSKHTHLILLSSKDNPEKFANFELRYSWRMLTKGGNSGVQIRGKIDKPEMFHVGGYQADIDAGNSFTGIIYDEGGVAGGRGIMSKRGENTLWDEKNVRSSTPLNKNNAEIKKDINPCGEWNDCVVKAEGNHIVCSINGQVTTELTDNSPKALKSGVIGLQMHGGHTMTIQFKDIRIKMQ